MPITAPIPLPEAPGDALVSGTEWMNKLLMAPYERREKAAKASQEEALAKLPFGGHFFPGVAGQLQGLEAVKMMYGEGSPQYKQAKQMFDLEQQSTQSRIGYQNALTETLPKRTSTTLAKTAQEYEDIKNGNLPGTKIPLNDQQRKYYEGVYGLDITKKITDADTRKRNLFANNIEVTQSKIDPVALTQYSGLQGTTQLLKDRADSARGKPSEQYEKYKTSLTAAQTMAKQVRQFYGDSIDPRMQDALKKLTNPSTWMDDPKIALAQYKAFTDLLNQEMSTYRQATESPAIYQSNRGEPTNNQPAAAPSPNNAVNANQNVGEQPEGNVEKVVKINGEDYYIINGIPYRKKK